MCHTKREFVTILNTLKSPQNVGMIVRSHVAFGGNELIFTGHELPWKFKKGSQAFFRKLETQATIIHIPNQYEALAWCQHHQYQTTALEIISEPTYLHQCVFPQRAAFIVGNEATGLAPEFTAACDHVLTIPQFGYVGSLNVAVSASIAMYEYMKNRTDRTPIEEHKYRQRYE